MIHLYFHYWWDIVVMQSNMVMGTYLQSIREENSDVFYNNKIYVKHRLLSVLSLQREQSYCSTLSFFPESSILFGKLKLSIFVSTSYCINTVNLCFNFHQGLIKMLQKFCSV